MSDEVLTCESCGKQDATVREVENCVYQYEINPDDPPSPETICDECEHQHRMDI